MVFIYSSYINSGVIPLQLALEQNGYKKYSGEKILKYPEWNGRGENTKREPLSYDGLLMCELKYNTASLLEKNSKLLPLIK